MRDILGERVVVDFMIIANRISGSGRWICYLFLAVSCGRDLSDDPIPIATFADYTINLALPEYLALGSDGGYKPIGTIGVRGVIVYRQDATTYYAYERNCSYHPNDACATVDVHSSHLYMICTCCGSNFSFSNGAPTGGVAWRPLRRYKTQLSGVTLVVTSAIQN